MGSNASAGQQACPRRRRLLLDPPPPAIWTRSPLLRPWIGQEPAELQRSFAAADATRTFLS